MAGRQTLPTIAKTSKNTASAFLSKSDRMVQRLYGQHEVGRAAVAAEKDDQKSTGTFAAEKGLSSHTVRKLKSFARCYYADGDKQTRGRSCLGTLCRLRRKGSKLGLHFGHLVILLGISKASDRLAWAQKTADNDWSPQQLRDEYRKGKPAGSGPPLRVPATPLDGLAQVLREGTRWMARCELAVATCEAAPKQCRDAEMRKMAEDVRIHWQTMRSKLAHQTKRLQAVATSSTPTPSKTKPQPRSGMSR